MVMMAVAVFFLFLFSLPFLASGSGWPGGLGLEAELGWLGRCCVVAPRPFLVPLFSLLGCIVLVVASRNGSVGSRRGAVARVSYRCVMVGVGPWRVDGGKDAPPFGRARRLHPSPAQGPRNGVLWNPTKAVFWTVFCVGRMTSRAQTEVGPVVRGGTLSPAKWMRFARNDLVGANR